MISETAPYNNYTGNGVTTQFDFDFYIEDENQLTVLYTNSGGAQSVLTYDVDYSIHEFKNKNGSYIVYPLENSSHSVLASGEVLSLVLDLPIAQESEYGTSSELDMESLEYSLDYLTRIAQIQDRKLQRALKVLEGSSQTPDELMAALKQAEVNAAAAASNASSSATAAAGSASSASGSATAAQNWATKTDGTVDGTNYSAKYYANSISGYLSEAAGYASSASTSASSASTSATNAANSASSASTSATNAAGSATAAAGSASSASTSASSASTSATSAANNASSASTSATAAAGSASSASTSATAAQNWATKMDGKVEGNDYSAKYWAKQAQDVGAKDSEITLTQGGSTIGTFTLNQATDKTIDIPIASTVDELNDLDDVTLTNVQNGQVLKYDSTSQKFVNAADDDTKYEAGTGISLNSLNNEFSVMQADTGTTGIKVVGTLTNNDGEYSGFARFKYLKIDKTMTLAESDSVEFCIAARTNQTPSSSYIYYVCGFGDIYLALSSSSFYWSMPPAFIGSSQYSQIDLAYSSDSIARSYNYFKLKRECSNDSTTITLYYSSDGITWMADTTQTFTTISYRNTYTSSQLYLGFCNISSTNSTVWTNGYITPSKCSIKINGDIFFSGENNLKEVARATNNLYGLVKPDGSTIAVNNGVISCSYNAGTGLTMSGGTFNLQQTDNGASTPYTIIGTLTEPSSMVYTGFSGYNYIQGNCNFTVTRSDTLEAVIKFRASTNSGNYYIAKTDGFAFSKGYFQMNGYYNLAVYKAMGGANFGYSCASCNKALIDNSEMRNNYTYFKLYKNSSYFYFYVSRDGEDWILTKSVSLQTNNSVTIDKITLGYGSGGDSLTDGYIDLSGCYMKLNEEYVWNPSINPYKPVAKATDSLYGLVKPDGTSITINDGVISTVSSGGTYTVGTGLDLTNDEFSIVQTNSTTSNFSIVGSPIITDGVASDFSDYNYIAFNNPLSSSMTSFEVVTAFNIASLGSGSALIDSVSPKYSIRLQISDTGKLLLRVSSNGSNTYALEMTGSTTLSNNTKYYVKVTYSSTTGYAIYLSTDGTTWTSEATSSITTLPYYTSDIQLRMGDNTAASGYSFNGSIYLNDTYVKVNGSTVWTPYTIGGVVAMATDNLYGLVKPDGSSITVNDGVISADIAAYLQSVSGYDGTAVQTLQHDADGNLSWV